jgi:hypothetical protein
MPFSIDQRHVVRHGLGLKPGSVARKSPCATSSALVIAPVRKPLPSGE